MLAESPVDQIRDALEQTAVEVLAEAGIGAPPVDMFKLAARLGLTVARDGWGETRARFVQLGGPPGPARPTILLADEPRVERRHWALAHEVGEYAAHRVFAELGVDPAEPAEGAREAVANRLAGCLLLPRRWFLADGYAVDWDLFELKSIYATASHEMIARRMLEMPPRVIVTMWDQGRQAWRRGNGSCGRPAPLTTPERDAWRIAHGVGEPARCDPGDLPEEISDVRAWPVHEPHWKREFARMAIQDLD
ncbi:MAG TPA: ImmA/IrrE family metallo-endopeptidase [Lacipirellulaceae bacterium]|nr:ImmA/IrrE family metallo-endopeptidase [Lacipirellulaceae bacterium]